MDKIELRDHDIQLLLEWRDKNPDLVRSFPCPLKSVEIVCKDTGFHIKGFRKGQKLKLHLNHKGISLGSTEFNRLPGGALVTVKGKDKMQVDKDKIQSCVTVYCSLMALMAYASPVPTENEDQAERKPRGDKTNLLNPAKRSKHITYILHSGKHGPSLVPQGSHASPSGVFTVRGHWRHLKDGKVIWVNEFKKGEGKKKNKTYRLGGQLNG